MRKSNHKAIAPLQSWDLYAQYLTDNATRAEKIKDQEILEKFKSKYEWNIDFNLLLKRKHTAVIITDAAETIQWVNAGFTEMTGYSKKETIGRHPNFLQGEKTSSKTKKEVRTQLDAHQAVSHKILNYKKNGEPYMCTINIFPLRNDLNKVTHFIALEYKSKAA